MRPYYATQYPTILCPKCDSVMYRFGVSERGEDKYYCETCCNQVYKGKKDGQCRKKITAQTEGRPNCSP